MEQQYVKSDPPLIRYLLSNQNQENESWNNRLFETTYVSSEFLYVLGFIAHITTERLNVLYPQLQGYILFRTGC